MFYMLNVSIIDVALLCDVIGFTFVIITIVYYI